MAQTIDTELIDKSEIEIEKVPQAELNEREEGVPSYKERLDYDEEQIKRLKDEIFDGYERLKKQRGDDQIETKWDNLEAQYKGQISDDSNLEFSLNVPITMVKVDSIVRLGLKAFLESDPKFTVTPRPQTAKMDKWNVTVEKQADYLDYKLDEDIDLEGPLRMVLHQAALLDMGILKVPYEFKRKKRRREETFSGKPVPNEETGEMTQPGLESFLRQYPDSAIPGNDGHWVLKDLAKGKDVTFKANFMEVVYDDPKPYFVDIRDLYIDKHTEGYEGFCDSKLIIERQPFTWWELKAAEQNEDFINVDDCKTVAYDDDEDKDKDKNQEEEGDFKQRKYKVLNCVYSFNEKDSDNPDDENKILCFFESTSKAYLGAILYPYDAVDSFYVPFYIKKKIAGLYKGGMAEDLTDSHLTQTAILNFMLTESWQQLMTTPIVEQGSPIADQFLNKRWKPGVPIELPIGTLSQGDAVGFLDKTQKGVAQQLLPILSYLARMDDDRTGISSLMTGKESPMDPTAPAAKTAMLLEQSGINISDYINCLLPSFNMVGQIILQLTYQMAKEGRPFRHKQLAGQVTGGDPFDTIGRDEMVAKTNIQSRAAAFAFDKINEKRENLALFQTFRQDPIVAQDPEQIYTLARTLIQSWSPLWKNKVDHVISDPETFNQKQIQMGVQALAQYLEIKKKEGEITGGSEPNFNEFVQMATKMLSEALTPTEDESKTNER